jgi:hypothetical protein
MDTRPNNMHLAEFVLLVVATVAAIAAGLAMVVSNYRVARILFWIAALSFGSLGIVWSAQSHGYSLATQMAVAAICAAVAAAGLVWGLDELRERTANAEEVPSVQKSEPAGKNSPSISAGRDVSIGHIGDVINNNGTPSGPQDVGTLRPAREVLLSGKEARRIMEIGDSGAKLEFGGPQGDALFKFFGRSEILLESVGGKLMVSSQLFDEDGKLSAELIQNDWKVAPPPKTWDRNYTDNSLEVKNAKGNVILQIRMLPDRIQLQGEWRSENGDGVQLAKVRDPRTGVWGGGIVLFKKSKEAEFRTTIKPIFRYPSTLHFGELLN